MHNRIKLTEIDLYEAYFKNLAEQHKEIDSFYSLNMEELRNGLRSDSNLNGRVLFLDMPDGLVYHNNSDNPLDKITGAVNILEPCVIDNFGQMREIWARCKKIGVQLFARVYNDFEEGKIIDFDPGTIKHLPVLPVPNLDNRVGYRFEFNITDKAALDLDETQWTDLDL